MIFLGSDPDTQTPSVAGVDEHGTVVFLWARNPVKNKEKVTGREAILSSFAAVQETLCDPSSLLGDLRKLQAAINNISRECLDTFRVVAFAVEAQEVYTGKMRTKNPRSIVLLANAAGAVAATLRMCFPGAELFFPAPQAWKGSVPKKQHHGHLYKRLGWTGKVRGGDAGTAYLIPSKTGLTVPEGFEEVSKGGWKHVNDSIGLALFARDEWVKRNRKKQWLAEREKAGAPDGLV